MTAKNSTFAGQLKHFAQTVDIVDNSTFNQIRYLIYKYVTKELKSDYFELLGGEFGNNGNRQAWLRTFWSSDEKLHLWPIRVNDGTYTNPVTNAFDKATPMWLINPDKKPLDEAAKCQDLWSHTPNLSQYQPSAGQPVRTAVVVPLSFQRLMGVFYMESSEYMEATDVGKLELSRLADALAMLYGLWDVNQANSRSKDHAIGDLRDLLDQAKFPKLAKPHVFVAFSERADEAVRSVINDVLGQYEDKLEFTDWTQMDEAGSITEQIGKEILASRFGICYLSEQVEPDGPAPRRFNDNSNVVFEAGMLHARTSVTADTDEGGQTGWIPIRERNSPPPPFDFSTQRILYIPRSKSGELNEPRLREMLKRRIARLLGQS